METLPGFAVDPSADVPWLRESTKQLTLRPGAHAIVRVTLDSGVPQITQPGDYSAQLVFGSTTPYTLPAAPVTLHVAPPKSQSPVTGTIYGVTAHGGTAPLAGATVRLSGSAASYTLTTDTHGHYAVAPTLSGQPLTITVSSGGYQSVVTEVNLKTGAKVTENITLTRK